MKVCLFFSVVDNFLSKILHADKQHINGNVQKSEHYRLNAEEYLPIGAADHIQYNVDNVIYPYDYYNQKTGIDNVGEEGP